MSNLNTFGTRLYSQYFVNGFGLPFEIPVISGSRRTSFCAGPDEISISPAELYSPNIYDNLVFTQYLPFPDHPQQGQYGIWLNKSTTTKITLRFPAFVDIDIPADFYYKQNINAPTQTPTRGCWITVSCNGSNGDASLSISDNNGNVTNRVYGNLGVPIYLNTAERDIAKITCTYMNMAGNTLIAGTLGRGINTNTLREVVDDSSGLISAIQHPTNHMVRGNGGLSLAYVGGRADVICEFQHIAERDNSRFGSPLHKRRTIKDLSGFIVCKTPHVHAQNLLAEEQQTIETYMEGGFFYE